MGVDRLVFCRIHTPKISIFSTTKFNIFTLTLYLLFPNKAWGGGSLALHGVGQPISLGFLIGSLFQDFFDVVEAAASMFQELSQAVAIHVFGQGIGELCS